MTSSPDLGTCDEDARMHADCGLMSWAALERVPGSAQQFIRRPPSDSGMVSVNREDLALSMEWATAGFSASVARNAARARLRAVLDAPSEPPVVETPSDLADSERSDAPMTIHRPSYLAGWNDAKAGRQYGEGRAPSEPPEYEQVAAHWCPVHGTSLCPEQYMLNRDGVPFSWYRGSWHERMRCGRRDPVYRRVAPSEPEGPPSPTPSLPDPTQGRSMTTHDYTPGTVTCDATESGMHRSSHRPTTECINPVPAPYVVAPMTDADYANETWGDRYGVDWVYPDLAASRPDVAPQEDQA